MWVPEEKEVHPDTVDAFAACCSDLTQEEPTVKGQDLIKIIKEEFELTIDILKMIREVDDVGFSSNRTATWSSNWASSANCLIPRSPRRTLMKVGVIS